MHLTNFHFYPYKNYLDDKPVKGLQGFGVGYGFSFNGKENDKEVSFHDFGLREYDFRLTRFISTDPYNLLTPYFTPYCFAGNSPVASIDYNGGFKLPFNSSLYLSYNSNTKILEEYIMDGIQELLLSPKVTESLMRLGKFNSITDLKKVFEYGSGPEILFATGPVGEYFKETDQIYVDTKMIALLEYAKTPESRQAALFAIVAVIIHETTHYGRDQFYDPENKGDCVGCDGQSLGHIIQIDEKNLLPNEWEVGNVIEYSIWGQFIGIGDGSKPSDELKSIYEIVQRLGRKHPSIPQIKEKKNKPASKGKTDEQKPKGKKTSVKTKSEGNKNKKGGNKYPMKNTRTL